MTKKAGGRVVIVNLQATRLDSRADLVIHHTVDDVMAKAGSSFITLWRIASFLHFAPPPLGGSVAEWLACWTQAQKARVQIAVATLSGNSHRQTVHTHCASVNQATKLVAALLSVAGVTAGLAESNGSLPPGL